MLEVKNSIYQKKKKNWSITTKKMVNYESNFNKNTHNKVEMIIY